MKKFFLPIFCLLLFAACSGRMPKNETSQKIIRKHFYSYGKKYKQSPFGGKKVEKVEVLKVEEIRKDWVTVMAFVTIEGPEVFKVRVTMEKGPFGWRYIAWENMGG